MSYILAATDFSEVADHAVHYACRLAMDSNEPLHLIHSFITPVTFSENPMPVMPLEEARKIADDRMQYFTGMITSTYPQLEIHTEIMFGDLVDCIEEYTEKAAPWLVILGNSGTGSSTLWLGSNALNALRNLPYTVLAVPLNAEYKKPDDICLASDLKDVAGKFHVSEVVNLVKHTGAQLHVLHINNSKENAAEDISRESGVLHDLLSSLNPVYHYVTNQNVEKGVQDFIEENDMDWLLMIPHKLSFFESLFHKSHTKAILKILQIPLAALHEH